MSGGEGPAEGVGGFRSVVFDCDSTLVGIEGIDWLAGPRLDEVRGMTELAMAGAVPLEEVYGRRLTLIEPTRAQVTALGRAYVESLVEDAEETVAALLWLGKTVRVVSGGLRPPVEAVAAALGLGAEAVAAVGVQFTPEGRYAGYDREAPAARSDGKAEVIRAWRLPRPSLLVGDGATDLEARPAVDCFAAYMGVALRPAVAGAAEVVLRHASLAPVLALAADARERERLRHSKWAGLVEKGERVMNYEL